MNPDSQPAVAGFLLSEVHPSADEIPYVEGVGKAEAGGSIAGGRVRRLLESGRRRTSAGRPHSQDGQVKACRVLPTLVTGSESMFTLPKRFFATAGHPGKSGGGYAEPKPDQNRVDDAEDSFHPEYEQGREPKETPSEREHEKPPHDET